MEYRPLPIGISDFADMIRQEFYYVDKTLMIRDVLDNKTNVTLFTRPRRFGKMLNMSMFILTKDFEELDAKITNRMYDCKCVAKDTD